MEVAFLFEVGEGFVDGVEDFVGGLGDEGGGVFFGFPDDEDVFGVFVGVLEFAFDAGGETWFATGEFGDVGDDHVGLADEGEIAGVDLAVDVGDDLEDVLDFEGEREVLGGRGGSGAGADGGESGFVDGDFEGEFAF